MADKEGGKGVPPRLDRSEPSQTELAGGLDSDTVGSLEHEGAVPATSGFQDEELIEEAKYHSPAPVPPPDEGDLPDSYGQPRVTLLVVNPYLVYACWDVDLANLPRETIGAVLRFHDGSQPSASRFFEVDVDLRTRSWYVHLWSPAKSYYADLAVKTADGGFTPLARSNLIQTPRAWPMAGVERSAETVAKATPVLAELGSAQPSGLDAPPSAEPGPPKADEPARVEVWLPPEHITGPKWHASVQSPAAVSPTGDIPQPQARRPVGPAEVLQQQLTEIQSLRQWPTSALIGAVPDDVPSASAVHAVPLPEAVELPMPAPASPPSTRSAKLYDLTTLAERQFALGSTSARLSSQAPERHSG